MLLLCSLPTFVPHGTMGECDAYGISIGGVNVNGISNSSHSLFVSSSSGASRPLPRHHNGGVCGIQDTRCLDMTAFEDGSRPECSLMAPTTTLPFQLLVVLLMSVLDSLTASPLHAMTFFKSHSRVMGTELDCRKITSRTLDCSMIVISPGSKMGRTNLTVQELH